MHYVRHTASKLIVPFLKLRKKVKFDYKINRYFLTCYIKLCKII